MMPQVLDIALVTSKDVLPRCSDHRDNLALPRSRHAMRSPDHKCPAVRSIRGEGDHVTWLQAREILRPGYCELRVDAVILLVTERLVRLTCARGRGRGDKETRLSAAFVAKKGGWSSSISLVRLALHCIEMESQGAGKSKQECTSRTLARTMEYLKPKAATHLPS